MISSNQKQLPSPSTYITSLFGTFEATNSFSAFLASSTSICPRSDDIVPASVSDSSSASSLALCSSSEIFWSRRGSSCRWRACDHYASSWLAFDQALDFSPGLSQSATRSSSSVASSVCDVVVQMRDNNYSYCPASGLPQAPPNPYHYALITNHN